MKKKISLILIVLAASIHLLKITSIPNSGLIVTFASMTISCFFYLLLIRFEWEDDNNFISEEIDVDDSPKTNSKLRMTEFGMFLSLSTLIIGGLFKVQHWPGADVMLKAGGLGTAVCALANLALGNSNNCSYSKALRIVSLASIALTALFCTDFYWDFLQTRRYKDYSHYIDAYNKDKKSVECLNEQWKIWALNNADEYNRLDSLLIVANKKAEGDNAKVIYLLNDMGVESVYDPESSVEPIPLEWYKKSNEDLFANPDTKFYVVTNQPEDIKSKLTKLSAEGKEIIIME